MADCPVLRCGDVVYMAKFPGATPHPWVIVTEPNDNGEIAMVNITTPKSGSDMTVVLEANEHHRVTHRSVVYYQDARITLEEAVRGCVTNGLCIRCDPCSPEMLKKIQDGLPKSERTPKKVIAFLSWFSLKWRVAVFG